MNYYGREEFKGYSPWGGIQTSKVIKRGLKRVATASHGGYMVTKNFANKYLSDACKEYGEEYGNYLCYEEDCLYAVLLYDIADKVTEELKDCTLEEYKNSLLRSISRYYPEYLIEKGVEPLEEPYREYLMWEKQRKMREEKNPNLIISASSMNDNVVKVWTADRKTHFVSKVSYSSLREERNCLLLLSECELVEYKEVV